MDNSKGEVVLVCENSTEGILSAVYEAYKRQLKHEETYIQMEMENYRLFARYEKVDTDSKKVNCVLNTLRREFYEEDVLWLYYALAGTDADRGQAVYRTIVAGRYQMRAQRRKSELFHDLKDPYIHKAFTLARKTSNEVCRFKGFLRFEEMENGILFARIAPQNDILSFLSMHFADRFPMEAFVIYDESRKVFSIHAPGKNWYLLHDKEAYEALEEQWSLSGEESDYQELFRYFCHKISIKERENLKLQMGMLPLRFRGHMTEFKKNDAN